MVARQDLSPPVQNFPPGSVDLHRIGTVAQGLLFEGIALENLPVEKLKLKDTEKGGHNENTGGPTAQMNVGEFHG